MQEIFEIENALIREIHEHLCKATQCDVELNLPEKAKNTKDGGDGMPDWPHLHYKNVTIQIGLNVTDAEDLNKPIEPIVRSDTIQQQGKPRKWDLNEPDAIQQIVQDIIEFVENNQPETR